MANGILLKSNPKPPFQAPTFIGINRAPELTHLDPEKLLNLGLDLTSNARDKATEACNLFSRLDWLSRLNRNSLEDEDVIKALTNLREDAEVLLERGLYSLDVAQEIRTRLVKHNPEHGETFTRDSAKRWRQCFYALSGVWARAYLRVYGMVLGAPTCGDLSHVPPKLHFDQPSREARKRYNNRLSVAVGGKFPLVVDYWRCRLVKGIEAGNLPGSVVLQEEVSKWPPEKARTVEIYNGNGYSETLGDNTYVGEKLAGLIGPDCTSFVDITQRFTSNEPSSPRSPNLASEPGDPDDPDSPSEPAPGGSPKTPGATIRPETITEGSIDELMGTPGRASTPKRNQREKNTGRGFLRDPIAKSAQANTARVSRRLQEKRETKNSAPKEPEPPAPPKAPERRKRGTKSQEPAEEPAKKKRATKMSPPSKTSTKRKRSAETGDQDSPDALPPKRPRVLPLPMKLKLRLTEGHDMSPLTDAEMAQLPWNKDKTAGANVAPSKYVLPMSGYLPLEPGDLADIQEWAENRLPTADDDFDSEDEVSAKATGPAEPDAGDYMKVEKEEPMGTSADNTKHAVEDPPSQGGGSQSSRPEAGLHTPSRFPPVPESVDPPWIGTSQQFEEPRPSERPTPFLPIAAPRPQSYASQPQLPPHMRTWTSAIYKPFPPNEGIYSPNINTPQFEAEPDSNPTVTITTSSFLRDPSRFSPVKSSLLSKGDTPKAGEDPTSSPSGEKPATSAAAKASVNRSSPPRVPAPGGKPDNADTTKPLGEDDGLWGSTHLGEHGIPKGPGSEAAKGQNPSSRGASPGASKYLTPRKARDPPSSGPSTDTSKSSSPSTNQSLFGTPPSAGSQKCLRTPPNGNSSSSEPTTGASQTPSPSVGNGSTYIDPESRLHFPEPRTPETPSKTPAAEGEYEKEDPPSRGSGKSKASVSSADRAAINDALQEDIEKQEEAEERRVTLKALEQAMLDRSLLRAAGTNPDRLSPTAWRETILALEASARDEENRCNSTRRGDPDTERTHEPKGVRKGESRKGSEQNKGLKEDAQKTSEKKGSKDSQRKARKNDKQKEDVATWRAESDYQPEKVEDSDDLHGREVWDI